MPSLREIRIGQPAEMTPRGGGLPYGRPFRTAIVKLPVAGPIQVGELGLEGDGQANLRVHGGPDKAVCVYPVEHYADWGDALPLEGFGPGALGENFVLEGLDETTVRIGELWRIGSAEFRITQARQPCRTLLRRWGTTRIATEMDRRGWTGWYLAVTSPGLVEAGQMLEVLHRPEDAATVAEMYRHEVG